MTPQAYSCTLMSEGGGFAGRTGMYFIDLCKGEPRLTGERPLYQSKV